MSVYLPEKDFDQDSDQHQANARAVEKWTRDHEDLTEDVHGIADTSLLAVMLSGWTFSQLMFAQDVTVDLPNVAANSTANHDFTLTGVLTTDRLMAVHAPPLTHGLFIQRFSIPATDTIRLRLSNVTGAGINEASSSNYSFLIVRP